MPNYRFLKKKRILNLMEFFEKYVFFGQNKQLKKCVKKKYQFIGKPLSLVIAPVYSSQ